MKQPSDQRLRVILLGAGGRPDIMAEAERLWPTIEEHATILLADFAGSENLTRFHADLAIVFGGDGSILRAARQMGYRQLPIVAVNLGKLGYLANIAPDELAAVLADYQAGKLKIAEHLMFECSLMREKKLVKKQLGLNEVAVLAGMPFSLITLNLYVDSELATTYSGDGLLIATPVGSTAHSLSAGGPILRQSISAFVVVPLSPHTLTNRPVVDTAERVYELEVVAPNPGTTAVVDGKVFAALRPGDRLRVEAAASRFKLITGKGHGYYRTLREKLGWGGQFKQMTKSK
jgi:NAD+ kinase